MKAAIVVIACLILAACGADGEPVQPTVASSVTLSNHGVSAGTSLGLSQGPLSMSLGLSL